MSEEASEGAVEATENTGEVTPSYFLSEGVGGSGDAPDWFKGDKYKTVSDQAKAYKDLEGKFGSFTGAPEEYGLNAPENFEINGDDPMLAPAMEWAKGQNMSQEGFDSLLGMYAEMEASKDKAFNDFAEEQKSQIENFESRQENINDFLKANDLEALAGMITTKDQMDQFEKLLDKSGNTGIDPNAEPTGAPTQEDVEKLMFEKDEFGRQIYNYDQERQSKVRKMIEARVGKGSGGRMVG